MLVTVRVHPKASRPAVAWDGEVLSVWVDAPAVDGKANRRALEVVARELGVRRSAVRIVRGERARWKVLEIEGVDVQDLAAASRKQRSGPTRPPAPPSETDQPEPDQRQGDHSQHE